MVVPFLDFFKRSRVTTINSFTVAHHIIRYSVQSLKNNFQINNNEPIWWDDKDLCIQKALSSLPVPKISYLFRDVPNCTPQPSLWYPSYPAPNSTQLWVPLFLLIFLSSSLEVLNLWATHEHDSNVAEQVYISPGLQTELLPVMSISFQVNFWQHSFVGQEKSALFGVKWRKGWGREQLLIPEKCLLEIHLLQGRRISLLRCIWGEHKPRSTFLGSRPDALEKASKEGQKESRGGKVLSP